MAAPVKHAMSLEEIAETEGTSVAAISMLLGRAFQKTACIRPPKYGPGVWRPSWTATGKGLSNDAMAINLPHHPVSNMLMGWCSLYTTSSIRTTPASHRPHPASLRRSYTEIP
jgi:hypothetical protein